MKSRKAKVLHPLCGIPLVHYVCDTALQLDNKGVYVVVGEEAESVKATLKGKNIRFVHQLKQLGTADAVMAAREALAAQQGGVIVLYADSPLIRTETLETLHAQHLRSNAAATVLTVHLENPYGYGRILRDKEGKIERIVEERDAQPAEKEIKEINTGVYCFDIQPLYDALKRISNDNAQGEYYLTDVIGILKRSGKIIETATTVDSQEVLGINTRYDLAQIEKRMRAAILKRLMLDGVTIVDPDSTYIDANVRIGPDTTVYPNVTIEKSTKIGENCVIHTSAHISHSELDDDVTVWPSTVIHDSRIGRNSTVGPFAHLRNHTVVGERCRVGNFVEIKNSRLGNETKAAHLAYLGDAEIGDRVNIGAGTITCNYDGAKKNKTIIEDDVFIGSDSQLIAPVTIGKGAYVAAGSSITEDVPSDSLAIARGRQVIKPEWAKRRANKS